MQNKTKLGILFVLASTVFTFLFLYVFLIFIPKMGESTLIDNPTSKNITVEIDNVSYPVSAMEYLKVELEAGKHIISCKETGLEKASFLLEPVTCGVINPTKSKYIIYNIIFTEKPEIASQFKAYTIEGKEVYSLLGEPELTTDLFIPDLSMGKGNIDIQEPSNQYYSRISQDYTFLRKIFRKKDFFEFWKKNNPE